MLNHELRADLPRLHGGGVGVVSAVDLKDLRPCHDLLRLAGVDEATDHVDVAVEYVVLWILVSAVHALLGEHHCDVGAGHARDVGVEVDRTADLLLDHVEGLPACANLLSGDGYSAYPLGGSLEERVDVRLSGGADDHDVVGSVPGGHTHPSDVVLEATRGYLCSEDAVGLRVDIAEAAAPGKRYGVLDSLCRLVVIEIADPAVLTASLPPGPSSPLRAVALKVLEYLFYVEPLLGIELHHAHPFPKISSTVSHCFPSARASPASRTDTPIFFERRHTTLPAPLPISPL